MELGEPDESGRRRPVPVEGKFETLPVTCVISAIGQKANVAGFEGIELNRKGIIAADETSYRTSMEGVFAVGDATNQGASIAIEAIGEARRCAKVVDLYLHGVQVPYQKTYLSVEECFSGVFRRLHQAAPGQDAHPAGGGAQARLPGDQPGLFRGPGPGRGCPLPGLRLPRLCRM